MRYNFARKGRDARLILVLLTTSLRNSLDDKKVSNTSSHRIRTVLNTEISRKIIIPRRSIVIFLLFNFKSVGIVIYYLFKPDQINYPVKCLTNV